MNNSRKIILLLSFLIGNQALYSITPKQIFYTCMGTLALRYTLPPAYRIGRSLWFHVMSCEGRLKYAREFYYKTATFYFEAINKKNRNEADLQTIIASGIHQVQEELTFTKRFWRRIDFESLNYAKKRDHLKEYSFLYYEDKLRIDIAWMDWYIDHLQVGAPANYARKKQEMRNLVADLKRLHVEIKRSLNFQKETKEKKEVDDKVKQLIKDRC